ncbi:MAG: HU family DNA-binding protein [Planctomycetota bacterium]
MNKGQLVESVAAEMDVSKAVAQRAVDAVLRSITSGIKEDQSVSIVGFGSFNRKLRAARTVRNPATGEPMEVKESVTVGFKPSTSLRTDVS